MSIDFGIVWIDDTPGWVNSVIGGIEEYIRELEFDFEPNIKRFETGDNIENHCADFDLDLAIVDCGLPERTGPELISALREFGVFKESVVYSMDADKLENAKGIGDVFFAERDDAVEEIKRVIDIVAHKLSDVETVRGLLIASTIDIENELEKVMSLIFGGKAKLFEEKILAKGKYFDFSGKQQFVQSVLKDLVSAEREKEAKGESEDDKLDKLKVCKDKLALFDDEIIQPRNVLAHSRKTVVGQKIVLKSLKKRKNDVPFTPEWLRDCRVKFREHMQNLKQLQELLKPSEEPK